MPQIKLNKHEVYSYIATNLEWFTGINGKSVRYLPCSDIGDRINNELQIERSGESPYIRLSGATLTAMVYDGVLKRTYDDFKHCYRYFPVLPINENYKINK